MSIQCVSRSRAVISAVAAVAMCERLRADQVLHKIGLTDGYDFLFTYHMASITPVAVLGHVAREGRLFLGESPEQVGGSIGVSGRTIRRLEEAASGRPRDITLRTLASYYGMSPDFFRWVVRESVTGEELEERLRHRAELAGLQPVDDPMALALMLARHRPAVRRTREEAELEVLQSDVALLNDRRRRFVRQFVDELRLAQSEEIRRREGNAA